jgi:HSP20 family protein
MADTDWFPAVDVSDTGEEYLLEFDLPGLKREQVQISLDGDALLLVGTRLSPRSGGTSLRAERPVGAFVRRLVLPPDSCSDELYATLQEGVLLLHVPKNIPHKEKDESRTSQSKEPDYEYTHR